MLHNVKADSAAAKAGLKNHDILLELGSKKVSSQVNEFVKVLNEFKTGDKVAAVVVRKGKKETVKDVTLPEVPKANPFGIPGGIFPKGIPNFPGGIPNIQIPNIQIFPGGLQGANVLTIVRTQNGFTTQAQDGNRSIRVSGTIEGGKATVKAIEIRDGGETKKYQTVDQVPENLGDRVREMIRLSEGGGIQFQLPQKMD